MIGDFCDNKITSYVLFRRLQSHGITNSPRHSPWRASGASMLCKRSTGANDPVRRSDAAGRALRTLCVPFGAVLESVAISRRTDEQ